MRISGWERTKLLDICAPIHLDNTSLIESTLRFYHQYFPEHANQFVYCKTRMRYLCISLWESLNRQQTPRFLDHLCLLFDTSADEARKEIVRRKLPITLMLPSDYISTLSQCLFLPFSLEKLLTQYVSRIENNVKLARVNLRMLLASCILHVVENSKEPLTDFTVDLLRQQLDLTGEKEWDKVRKILQILPQIVK